MGRLSPSLELSPRSWFFWSPQLEEPVPPWAEQRKEKGRRDRAGQKSAKMSRGRKKPHPISLPEDSLELVRSAQVCYGRFNTGSLHQSS